MKSTFSKLALTAAFVLATTFTFSCSDSGGGGGDTLGPSDVAISSSGGGSSSSNPPGDGSSSSGGGSSSSGSNLPALTGTVSISGTAEVGQTLTAVTSTLGGSGDISYQWKRGGSTNIGTNSSTYQVQSADIGSTITVTVTRTGNSSSRISAPTEVVTDPSLPALTGTVSISGTPEAGQTLTAVTTSLGGSGTISYQWKSQSMMGGSYVVGTNSSTYVVDGNDGGNTITVTVTRTGNSGHITSDPTAAVPIPVTFNVEHYDGGSQITSRLYLYFSKDIVGLSVNDITLSGTVAGGITKSELIGPMDNAPDGVMYILIIDNVTVTGDLTVAVAKSNYIISPSSKTVKIFYPISVTLTAIANGSAGVATTQLTLTFSQAIPGITADDIDMAGYQVNSVVWGTISGSGPTYTLPITSFVGTGGEAGVFFNKDGYTYASGGTVNIYKAP